MVKLKGRPKKGKADRRENVLRVRLTPQERETLDAAAAVRAIDTSTWARMILLESARKSD